MLMFNVATAGINACLKRHAGPAGTAPLDGGGQKSVIALGGRGQLE